MRIVIGVHHYPPDYVAGVEVVTQNVAEWLTTRGHSVEVVCIAKITDGAQLVVQTDCQNGVVVHRLSIPLTGPYEPLGLRCQDESLEDWFLDLFRRSRPDLLHAQSCYLISASMMDAAKVCHIPTVVSLHDYWFFCPRLILMRPNGERCSGEATPADCSWCLMTERRRYRLLEACGRTIGRRLGNGQTGFSIKRCDNRLALRVQKRQSYLAQVLRSADQIVTFGEFAQTLLSSKGYSPENVHFVPQAIDLRLWQNVRRSRVNDVLRIGFIGQVASHKGVHLLIDAFQRLRRNGPAVELYLHGDNTRFPRYSAKLMAAVAGNPEIRFCGAYNNGRVTEILSNIDLLVVPSVWFETAPLVILEAFAARIPVVASRLPNLQYQVRDGIDGLLFNPDDASDLAKQLQRIVDEPALLDRLTNGIEPVRGMDQYMSQLEGIYRLAKRSSS